MSIHPPFTASPSQRSCDLQPSFISLEDWKLVCVSGPDALNYLQGQLTYDIASLEEDHLVHSGHCDPKGKLLAHLVLFKHNNNYFYLIRRETCENQVNDLKKYAVFSKLNINIDEDHYLFGIAGHDCEIQLNTFFKNIPLPTQNKNILTLDNGDLLLFFPSPNSRYILISKEYPHVLAELLPRKNNSQQWLTLDIEAGYPIITDKTAEMVLPQAANLDQLNALSFTKGCYRGQEMVARAKYRGANKRALYFITGTSERTPEVGEELEMQLGQNWRSTGVILAANKLANNKIVIQAILNNDTTEETILRVANDPSSKLTLIPLTYLETIKE